MLYFDAIILGWQSVVGLGTPARLQGLGARAGGANGLAVLARDG